MDNQKHYRVSWVIDIWADTPEQAARLALNVQRDSDSIATSFDVVDVGTGVEVPVDLEAKEPEVEILRKCEDLDPSTFVRRHIANDTFFTGTFDSMALLRFHKQPGDLLSPKQASELVAHWNVIGGSAWQYYLPEPGSAPSKNLYILKDEAGYFVIDSNTRQLATGILQPTTLGMCIDYVASPR